MSVAVAKFIPSMGDWDTTVHSVRSLIWLRSLVQMFSDLHHADSKPKAAFQIPTHRIFIQSRNELSTHPNVGSTLFTLNYICNIYSHKDMYNSNEI